MTFRPDGDPVAIAGHVRALRLSARGVVAVATDETLTIVQPGGAVDTSPLSCGAALLGFDGEDLLVVDEGYIMRRGPGGGRGQFVGESAPGHTRLARAADAGRFVVVVVEYDGEPPFAVVCDLRSPEGHALIPPEIDGTEPLLNALCLVGGQAVGVCSVTDGDRGDLASVAAARLVTWDIAEGSVVSALDVEPAGVHLGDATAFHPRGMVCVADTIVVGDSAFIGGVARPLGVRGVRDVDVDGRRIVAANNEELIASDPALEIQHRLTHGAGEVACLATACDRVALAAGGSVQRYVIE